MKFLKRKIQLHLNRTSFVIAVILFIMISALLVLGIQSLIRNTNKVDTNFLQQDHTKTGICGNFTISLISSNPEQISFNSGSVKKTGAIKAGQYISYAFQAQTGDAFNYKTGDNICVKVYTNNQQFLIDKKPLKDGQYLVLISTPSGSTTFDLEMDLKSPISQSKSFTSLKVVNQSQSAKSSSTFLGHHPYNEANQSRLTIISSYAQDPYQRFEYFDKEAGKALMKLIYAARDENVWIIAVSGFRDLEKQKQLFEMQIEKRGSEADAAKVSAPSGYSEHHTGYAIDLTDGQFPKLDITNEFVNTKAYRWLTIHAKEFGFEMSFPQNNPDGVMFEPWHWRFIGNPDAMNTFANARSVS
jgi:D-alanyl-D-alanine carboxypeptidase